jgi:hypothetical protein
MGDTSLNASIILRLIFKKIVLESVDLIHVAQVSVQWRTLVDMVMNLRDA